MHFLCLAIVWLDTVSCVLIVWILLTINSCVNTDWHHRIVIYLGENSPPRRHRHDSDVSPPRRQRHDSDVSPLRRQRNDSGASTPRRQRHDSDNSPPRRQKRDSDISPPRPRKSDSDNSPPRRMKEEGPAKKTLSGKTAGLSSAKNMRKEAEMLKLKELEMFNKVLFALLLL